MGNMHKELWLYVTLILVFIGIASMRATAIADSVTFGLTIPTQAGSPGQTLSFEATATADPSNIAAIYLNADTLSVDSPLIGDDSPFFINFPLFLNPGQSVTDILFNAAIPLGTQSGMYAGSFIMQGGTDSSAQDILAFAGFNVDVSSSSGTDVPEPATMMLLGLGLMGLAGVRRKIKK
jgi:hypothetical protein